MLPHCRKTIKPLTYALSAAYMDIDFTENLTVPLKYETQSLHWVQESKSKFIQVLSKPTVQSYHPYFSDTKVHDHIFIKIAMDEMLSEVNNMNSLDAVVIESDNCTAQYKSGKHFNNLQKLSNRLDKNIICLYRIVGHGKGKDFLTERLSLETGFLFS